MSLNNLDSLLDATLDDLADLPSFKPFPVGAHKALASFDTKEINGKAAIELNFKYVEAVELADPAEEAPKAGDTSSTMFMLDNEFGQGNFKKCAQPFAEAMGFKTMREVVEGVKDVECILVSGQRKDKNDPDKVYLVVKEIGVL
jgi:hypothetical protein